tara:strand:- start:1 stop:600 length:600 start_codon:yes stop_codon:yes gene_type:complete
MARTSQNLPYVFLSGVVIIVIVTFFVSLVPQYQSLAVIQADTEATVATRADRKAFLDTIDRKTNQLRTQAEHERELGLVLPSNQDVDDVLRIIDRRASEAGVVVARISNTSDSVQSAARASEVRGEESGIPAQVVPLGLRLSATGSYQQLRQLIDSLSSSVRLIDITKIELAAGSATGGEVLGAEIQLKFYSYAPSSGI